MYKNKSSNNGGDRKNRGGMRKKWFSDRNQISVLESLSKEFEAHCEQEKITLKEIARLGQHVVYEYCSKGNRKEDLLYAIKVIYENALKK